LGKVEDLMAVNEPLRAPLQNLIGPLLEIASLGEQPCHSFVSLFVQ